MQAWYQQCTDAMLTTFVFSGTITTSHKQFIHCCLYTKGACSCVCVCVCGGVGLGGIPVGYTEIPWFNGIFLGHKHILILVVFCQMNLSCSGWDCVYWFCQFFHLLCGHETCGFNPSAVKSFFASSLLTQCPLIPLRLLHFCLGVWQIIYQRNRKWSWFCMAICTKRAGLWGTSWKWRQDSGGIILAKVSRSCYSSLGLQ